MNEFVVNDEGVVNSHGFVLLNAAGRFERYNANPVLLYGHNTDNLIGRMPNLRIDGTRLVGVAEYDEEDALAVKCKRQAEQGFLKGCSPGISINAVELRVNAQGEEVVSVTDWELLEVSLCSVPSNRNALRLYNEKGELVPDGQVELAIKSMLPEKESEKMEMVLTVEAYKALGMDASDATAKSVSAAVMELQARVELAEEGLAAHRKERAEQLVTEAIGKGQLSADKKDSFVKQALLDYELTKDVIDAIPVRVSLESQVVNRSGSNDAIKARADWTYMQWAKEDPVGLKRMKVDDPEGFEALKKRIK